MHIDALEQLGGLDVLGSPKTDNQYHSGWGWAGSTPYKGVKLLASHLGGTRNPLGIRWPKKVAPDPVPRDHFLHCQRRRTDHLRHRGHRAPAHRQRCAPNPDSRSKFRPHTHRPIRARGEEDAVLRGHGQSGHLSRRLDGLDVRPAGAVAAGIATRNPRLDTRQRPLGAVSPRRGLVPGPRSGRRDARKARPDARTVRHRGRPKPGAPDRRWFVGAYLPPRVAHHAAVSRVGVPRRNHPHPRVLRAGAGKQEQHRHHRSRPALRMRAESFMRSADLPAGSLATWTTGTCATSTTVSSSPAPRSARPPNCSPARRRSSWRPVCRAATRGTARCPMRVGSGGPRDGAGAGQRAAAVHCQ